ncbi:trypsin-like peptidase domain-containing protein [Mycolicibacterium komossense]|uniref:Trypsin-like peptidase domain-containing protein n=2 Tax=Mycolicibacterium komossense TaxID=1779 RepID=A0ABT3CJ21_9MYCO|nr:trypsin-like peptidase domain-containing protein [Mycolicibacterium komossense]
MNVAMCAHQFFGLIQDPEIASAIGKPNPPAAPDGSPANTTALEPWSVADFSRYLSTLGLPGAGQVINVHQIVSAMERVGLLLPFGWDSRLPIMGQRYIAQGGASKGQLGGNLWLSLIFGAELIIPSYNAVTVQLAGNDRDGNPVDSWGTGLVIDHQHVITNKHVVTALVGAGGALSVHPSRNQGDVESVAGSVVAVPHPTLDVAVIKFDLPEGKLIPRVPGIGFRDPDWADEVYVFGYPRVPMTADMAITVQRGEVVNPAAETIPDRQKIFLYSAIARPGNSGGPIVAQDGRVIGLVVEDSAPCLRAGASGDDPPPLSSEQQLGHLADEVAELKAKAFAPSFYRGIPSSEIVRALDDLRFGGIIDMDTPL